MEMRLGILLDDNLSTDIEELPSEKFCTNVSLEI